MADETEVLSLSPDEVRDLIACRRCANSLKTPVTTQCGLSYCRNCLLDSNGCSTCPADECRLYYSANCPVDVTLQHVVNKLSALLAPNDLSPDSNLLRDAQRSLEHDAALNCPLCLKRFLNPVTTQCGHSFCQNCVRWIFETATIDAIIHCPMCRSRIDWPFKLGIADHHDPMADWARNQHLTDLIWTCWSIWVRKKRTKIKKQEKLVPTGMDIAVFVCTASWPGQVTLLRVFEPRYRRMLRRTMASSHRTFGMTMKDPNELSNESRVGTLLRVDNVVHGPDHVVLIHTTGVSRFRIKDSAKRHDGYWVASVDPIVDDATPTDWSHRDVIPSEAQMARLSRFSFTPGPDSIVAAIKIYQDDPSLLSCLSNVELMSLIRGYIKMRLDLHSEETKRIAFAQLRMPPDDNIDMIWWFSQVMGIRGAFAAKLLASESVRFRLESSLWYIICHIPDHYARIWSIE